MLMIFDLLPGTRFKKVRGTWWCNYGDDVAICHKSLKVLTQTVAKSQGIKKEAHHE